MEQLFDVVVRLTHSVAPHVIHAAWLGLAIAALPALILRFSSWGNAATRYAFCWGVLIVIVTLPATLAIGQRVGVELMSRRVEQAAVTFPSPGASTIRAAERDRLRAELYQRAAEGRAGVVLSEPASRAYLEGARTAVTPSRTPVFFDPPPAMSAGEIVLVMMPPLALCLIVFFSLYLLFRLVRALGKLVSTVYVSEPAPRELRVRADYWAERLNCRRALSVRVSETVQSPTATGYLKGIILLPPQVIDEFSAAELDAVLIHEISHIRRCDDWARLGEYLLAALFFCLPAVHWIIRQIDLQREIACDDLVLSQTGRPQDYARTLTRLAEMSVCSNRIELAPGAMITRKQIFARFTMILNGNKRRDNRLATRGLTTALTVLAATLVLVGQQLPAVALPGEAMTFADISQAIFDPKPPKDTKPAEASGASDLAVGDFDFDFEPESIQWQSGKGVAMAPVFDGAAPAPVQFHTPHPIELDFGNTAQAVGVATQALALADLSADNGPMLEALEGAVRKVGSSLRDLGNWEGSMIDIEDDGSRGSYEYRKDGHSYRLEFDGRVEMNDDLTDVAAIEPDGYLELEERDHGDRTRMLVESDRSGKLEYTYYVDGREQDLDVDGQAWFAATLAFTVKASGIGAEKRVQTLRRDSGVQAVLDEIEELPGGYARSRYYTELLAGEPLSADDRRMVFTHAGRWMDSDYNLAEFLIAAAEDGKIEREMMPDVVRAIDEMESDYEIRRVLTAIGVSDHTEPGLATEVLLIAGRMDSDYERAELLIAMAPNIGDDDELLAAYVDAVIGLDSDYETRRVLVALGLGERIDKKLAANVLPIAGRMDSDYEKVELLLDLARVAQTDDELIGLYLDVASSVSSGYELRRALASMRPELGTSEATLERYISLADQIPSDYERAEFLIDLADLCRQSPRYRAAYLRAADDISSDYDKSRVLKELIATGESDPLFLADMIRTVELISSDYEKGNLLRELVEPCAQFKELEDPFVQAIESLSGSYERDKLYRDFYRELRRLQ
jgi:beta-lactamase regulating signal transducer with metallopeptidase domain